MVRRRLTVSREETFLHTALSRVRQNGAETDWLPEGGGTLHKDSFLPPIFSPGREIREREQAAEIVAVGQAGGGADPKAGNESRLSGSVEMLNGDEATCRSVMSGRIVS